MQPIFQQCMTTYYAIASQILYWIIMVGKLVLFREEMKSRKDILIRITTHEECGHKLFFPLNLVQKVFCMRLKHQVDEKLFHQVDDFGVVVKTRLKNGRLIIEFGLVQMAMGHLERKLFCQRYNKDYALIQFYFRMRLGIIRRQNKKQRHFSMVWVFLMVQSRFVF